MATAIYQTKQSAQLYTKTGRTAGVYLSAGVVLECDWLWNTGALTGMRKIVAGPYTDYFVLGSDLTKYTPPPTPDPEPGSYIAEHEVTVVIDGVTWRCLYPQVTLERVG